MQELLNEWQRRVAREVEEGRRRPYAPEPLTDEELQELSEYLGFLPEELRTAHNGVCRAAEELELTDAEGRVVWDVCVIGMVMPTERYELLYPAEKRRVDEAIYRAERD
jgi:hypothetical protein